MSKEATSTDVCACGEVFAFPAYHWPHCPANPKNMSRHDLAELETKFSKRDLAIIESHGGGMMKDHRVRHVEAGARKPDNAKPKGKR